MEETELEQLSSVIGRVYDAALNVDLWPAVLEDISRLLAGTSALLYTPFQLPGDGGLAVTFNIPEAVVQRNIIGRGVDRLGSNDAFAKGLPEEGRVVWNLQAFPGRAFFGSEHYRSFLREANITRSCSMVVFGANSTGGPPTILCVGVPETPDLVGTRTKRRARVLLPHLSRSLGVTYRLRDAERRLAVSHAALDRLPHGVVILGGRGEVLHANRVARAQIGRGDGLVVVNDRLAAVNPADRRAFENALASCLEPDVASAPHFTQGVRLSRGGGARAYVINVAPLRAKNEFWSGEAIAAAIVFVSEFDRRNEPPRQVMKQSYGLSDAECRVAASLAAGESVLGVAACCGISEATTRTHLKRIFAKTGTSRQAQLVRLLASLASGPDIPPD